MKIILPKSKLNLLKKKDSSYRRRLGKKLNLVLTNNTELSEVLPDFSIKQTETVKNVVSNMSILSGLYIEHLWFTEQKQSILYHGHIISVKSTGKVPKATICYSRKKGKMKKYAYYSCLLTILLEISFLLIFLTCEMPFSLNGKIFFPRT